MKKNIRILIIASILGVIALSGIQAYLIYNTYKLEKDAFIEETKSSVFRFEESVPEIESQYETLTDFVANKIADYKLGHQKKADLFQGYSTIKDSLNSQFIALYQAEFKRRNLSHPVKFQKRLKSIIILEKSKNDTLYFESNNANRQHLLGELFNVEDAYRTNNSQTSTSLNRNYTENGEQKTLSVDFQITTIDYFNIDGWKKEVFKRMLGILALSILIFTLVLGLLYYAIKSLISQKKIADVKTDFINNITHELKTPLATLSLATKMLKKDGIKSQPQLVDNTVSTIERQNKRLQKLIDQVLNNSLGYKEIKLNKESVDIKDYIHTVLDDFELSVKSKDITINRTFSIANKTITLDKFYITTALLNILENAVKYSDDNVTIHFNVESNSQLNISIGDNGIGISDKDQKQIFEKFFRVGNKEIHNVKGLGLGLYYTNQIIKAHSGTIVVESKKDRGTTFIIAIPFN